MCHLKAESHIQQGIFLRYSCSYYSSRKQLTQYKKYPWKCHWKFCLYEMYLLCLWKGAYIRVCLNGRGNVCACSQVKNKYSNSLILNASDLKQEKYNQHPSIKYLKWKMIKFTIAQNERLQITKGWCKQTQEKALLQTCMRCLTWLYILAFLCFWFFDLSVLNCRKK